MRDTRAVCCRHSRMVPARSRWASLHLLALSKTFVGDLPGVVAFCTEKFCVVAKPFATGTELDDRHIPRDDHRDTRFSPGFKVKRMAMAR